MGASVCVCVRVCVYVCVYVCVCSFAMLIVSRQLSFSTLHGRCEPREQGRQQEAEKRKTKKPTRNRFVFYPLASHMLSP